MFPMFWPDARIVPEGDNGTHEVLKMSQSVLQAKPPFS